MTIRKKGLLIPAAALAVVVAVMAGGGSAFGGGSANHGAAALPTLRIGTVLPFTSGLAQSAKEMKTAFNLYIKQHGGKLGGLPVKVFYEDSQEQPALDVTLTKKLI